MPSRLEDSWSLGAGFHWGSTAIIQDSADEVLVVDAETRELRLTLQAPLTDRLSFQLQLPYRTTGGGMLDGFIDSFHETFGMSEGERAVLPKDAFRLGYMRDGRVRLNTSESTSGIGEVQASLGYQLLASEASSLATWLNVKLPTGDADDFTGSGATDVTLLLAGERRVSERTSVFGQAAVTWLGEGDFAANAQKSTAWSGLAGLSVRTWRSLSLKAQFDFHSAVFDSDLDYLSDAVVLTVGGDYKFASGWRLDVGISEDIAVEHSPDVVFVFALSAPLRR